MVRVAKPSAVRRTSAVNKYSTRCGLEVVGATRLVGALGGAHWTELSRREILGPTAGSNGRMSGRCRSGEGTVRHLACFGWMVAGGFRDPADTYVAWTVDHLSGHGQGNTRVPRWRTRPLWKKVKILQVQY